MTLELGVLRVLTQDEEATAMHGRWIEQHYPKVSTTSACIPDHPDGIPDEESEAEAIPYIVDLAEDLSDDVDAIAISCALDPAVDQLRGDLSIPVLGAGECVTRSALSLGSTVGTLTLESGVGSNVERLLGERHHATESVPGAETTNYLTTEEGNRAITGAAERLVDAGCDVIAPVCTGMTTAGVLPSVDDSLSVPVVDPVLAMGATASLLSYGDLDS